jgi:hypothetical protein
VSRFIFAIVLAELHETLKRFGQVDEAFRRRKEQRASAFGRDDQSP